MSNLNDYLSWRGDVIIDSNNGFNEIDSMILARSSYLIFDKIEMNEKETIKTISEKMKDFENKEFRYNGDKEMITKLGLSKRFQNMVVTDFDEISDKEVEKQFGAITIHISDDEMYISYIGTDSTIYGWKEDFNMSFMDYVPCQSEGKNYLEKIAHKYPNKKIRIGGHSKGGNVAIYSAIMTTQEIQDRIIKVYNYDGPGFNRKVVERFQNHPILNKIETYFPQSSIIGRIMEHKEKCRIVQSTEKGIYQHDIFSWEVIGNSLVQGESLTETSETINKTLTDWLENTTVDERKAFLDAIFLLFYATEAETFGEMSKNLSSNIGIILKTYHNITDEQKDNIAKMLKLFGKEYFYVFKEAKTAKMGEMKDYYINAGKKFLGKGKAEEKAKREEYMNSVEVITQSAIRIVDKSKKIIYFDPFRIRDKYSNDADIIFITHPHFDHFSPEDIEQIRKATTKIVAPIELEHKIIQMGFEEDQIILVKPNEKHKIEKMQFKTIPAYNINKDFHKKEYNWVGYIVTTDDKKIYVAGDTDNIKEAEKVKCDIAFVPIGGTYTMTWEEAVELVKVMKPEIAVPIHYGSIVGSIEDAEKFKNALVEDVEVEILMK